MMPVGFSIKLMERRQNMTRLCGDYKSLIVSREARLVDVIDAEVNLRFFGMITSTSNPRMQSLWAECVLSVIKS